MAEYRFSLQKYKRGSKLSCPKCGKWKNRSRLGQCAGADWDTFDAAKLMIFSETVAF